MKKSCFFMKVFKIVFKRFGIQLEKRRRGTDDVTYLFVL